MVEAVDDRHVELMFLETAQARLAEVAAQKGAMMVAEFAELENPRPHGCDIRFLRRERRAERHRDRIGKLPRPLEKILPALERENRAPELVQPHGNDRCFRLPCDEFVATLQSQQRSTARELALREDA